MADKGIIFSAAMVRALLDGRKTQTRRLCAWANNPNSPPLSHIVPLDDAPGWFGDEEADVCFSTGYAPGQRLYVREAWTVRGQFTDVVEVGYRASKNRGHNEYVEEWPVTTAVPGEAKPGRPAPKWPEWPKYGPSIHMPRWAPRLWLTVTDVRVQRLQDCSEADAKAEGLGDDENDEMDPRGWYRDLWNSLHTAESERWEDNPWIVAVSFDVHRGNIDA